jgi:hypothetical protein
MMYFAAGAAGALVKSVLLRGNAILLPTKIGANDCELVSLGTVGDVIVGGVCGFLSEDASFLSALNAFSQEKLGIALFSGEPSLAMGILVGFAGPMLLEMIINRYKKISGPPQCKGTAMYNLNVVFV